MALPATLRRFEIELADADRGVYEGLDWRVAQHPSENERYLVARVLARALEHAEGMEFGRGVSTDDEPAIWQRDLRGDLLAWIEVGSPSVERVHKVMKRCPRVAVYTWRDPERLAAELAEAEVHRADALELNGLDPAFLAAIAATLDRNNRWELTVTGGAIFLSTGGAQHESAVRRIPVGST